jgi:hypothetical protein
MSNMARAAPPTIPEFRATLKHGSRNGAESIFPNCRLDYFEPGCERAHICSFGKCFDHASGKPKPNICISDFPSAPEHRRLSTGFTR